VKANELPSVLEFARQKGLFRLSEATAAGIHPEHVRRMMNTGQLTRVARGLYAIPAQQATEYHTLAEIAKRVPQGIVCLLTALRFHGMGTQNPREVWLAVDRRAGIPRVEFAPVRLVRISGAVLTSGVDQHNIENVAVRITSPARTVVDCFKFRNKIGLDVAREALREALRDRRATVNEIWRYAAIARVTSVMRPYLEAMA